MVMIDQKTLQKEINNVIDSDFEIYPGIQGDHTICIPSVQLKNVIVMMMDKFDCRHLSGITAQIRSENQDVIEVLYHFWIGSSFSLMIKLPKHAPKLAEITSILPGADFYEREVAEMFGVEFIGREEIPPLLLPDDWDQGPPFI